MTGDLLIILKTYFILVGIQLLAWPWLFRYGGKLVDRGWASGRTALTLTLAIVIWFGAHLKIPINNNQGATVVLITLAALTWIFQKRSISPAIDFLKRNWGVIAIEEGLFFGAFLFYSLIRGYQPEILGLEKFMDFGFIKTYLSSPTLPAHDMWFAGDYINYYSFGHFWASILTRVFDSPAEITYNLILAFISATGMSLIFSIVVNLIGEGKANKRNIYIGGILSSILVIWGGNSHTVWSLLSKGSLDTYWYADATRFIHNTIHEFPAYSFVVSDLHGHVLGLPVVLMFLLWIIAWHRQAKERFIEVALGSLLGIMVMTNTWDSLIYGLLMVIYGLLSLLSKRHNFFELLRSALIIGLTMLLIALPWLIYFKSISNGVSAVTHGSPIWQLLVLWTLHLVITIWAMSLAVTKKYRNLLILTIGLTAITLLLIPEFVYVKDIYPNHPRANTMFKLTYQAFILMGILFGWVYYQVSTQLNKPARIISIIFILAVFGGLMLFPFTSFQSYYNGFKNYKGLNGFVFLKERFPSDLSLIRFLEQNRDERNLIESVGDSYTETDFISAFSGIPTVVGWRVHEWLWRGGYDSIGKREEEVRRFYEEGLLKDNEELIKKYNLGWIVVSNREREKYKSLNERKLKLLGKVVWNDGKSYLIRVSREY